MGSNMHDQRLVNAVPGFKRREDDVRRHRRAAEHVLAHRVGNGVQNRAKPGADRRLADAARTDRRLRIGDIRARSLSARRPGTSRIVIGRFW